MSDMNYVVLWLQCVCMITTGAISISKMMMVNNSLQKLYVWGNSIGDAGISAIAGALCNCMINELDVSRCGITLTGARSLAEGLSSNHTIRELVLYNNPITVEGALLLVEAAVHHTVCQCVEIDDEYKNDEIQKMRKIFKDKWLRQEVRDCVI